MSNPHQKTKDPITTKELIIETSILIGSENWSTLTFQHLADKTGISKGGITHHFKTKECLLNEIINKSLEELKFALVTYKDQYGNMDNGMAYLNYVLEMSRNLRHKQMMRIIAQAIILNSDYLTLWNKWYKEHIIGKNQINRTQNIIAMLIADGIWYSEAFRLNSFSQGDKDKIIQFLDNCQI